MKCKHNPCYRYNDARCCKDCLDDECEYVCGYKEDKPCKYEAANEADNIDVKEVKPYEQK